MATAWFQQPLFSLFSQLNFLLFKKGDNNQRLTVGFFLWAAAVALTAKHAPSSAITFDITGSVDPTSNSGQLCFLYLCVTYFLYFHFV